MRTAIIASASKRVFTQPQTRTVIARTSHDLAEAHQRVIGLYREIVREVPWIKATYMVELSHKQMRARIAQNFHKYAQVHDLEVLDMLLFKGQNELEETREHHKQRGHVQFYFKFEDQATAKKALPSDSYLRGVLDLDQ